MADDLLRAVIQLEKQIQHQVHLEQTRAEVWLARVRSEQEGLAREALLKLAEENEQLQRTADRNAKKIAAELEEKEQRYCSMLEEINDQVLIEVLRRKLGRLLPEQSDDHQDVES